MQHLWEIEHPYYCNEENYYAPGMEQPTLHYDSWDEFFDNEGDSDFDMNLLFRWDWQKADEDDEREQDLLKLFWIGQRKGLYRWTTIAIKDEDEPAVRAFLKVRWNYFKTLWEGIEGT